VPFPPGLSIQAFVYLTSAFSSPVPSENVADRAVSDTASHQGSVEHPAQQSADQGASGVSEHAESMPDVNCISRTICAIKDKIRWQTPAWSEAKCREVGQAVLTSAKRHNLSPTLLLAIMINESDLNEKSARPTIHDQKVYAKDSGLMAIRCVLDRREHCTNGNVRGMKWSDVMSPETNIELGARELSYWRDGGATTSVVVKLRDAAGHLRPVLRRVPCRHKDHAYWAHYNHGPHYINQGYPRHYPHRVAVIDHALATVLNVGAPELVGKRITMHDIGKRDRTVDRPMEARYKKLCTLIQSVRSCAAVAMN
jgi:hypothetical protein